MSEYATVEQFTAQFRPLTESELARLPALLRRASRMVDKKVQVNRLDSQAVEDAREVVLSMVSAAYPVRPDTEGMRSFSKAVGDRSESGTFADGSVNSPLGELVLLPWHLEFLGVPVVRGPQWSFPAPGRWW